MLHLRANRLDWDFIMELSREEAGAWCKSIEKYNTKPEDPDKPKKVPVRR